MKQQYIFTRLFSFLPVLLVAFLWLGGSSVFGQFILDGSTINSGDYTCGTSTISEPAVWVDESVNSLTICPAADEIVYIQLGTIVLNNQGGTGSDDVLTITQGAATLYQDGTNSNGADNVTVVGTQAGACVTITLAIHGNSNATADINATIFCLPAANAGADQNPGDCSSTFVLGGNDVSPATGTWTYSGPDSPIYVPNANDPNATVSGLTTTGVDHTFTWTSDDGTATHSDQMVFNSAGPGCATYCTPTFPSNVFSITNVTFAGINNTTATIQNAAGPNHEDFTGGTCASVTQGETYPLTITATGLGINTFYLSVFFDWNGDGDFSDAGEEMQLGTYAANSYTTAPIDITIPCDALVNTLRFRVMTHFSSYGTECNSTGYGQSEDYCITIAADPTPTAVATSVYVPCATSATLDATGSSITSGYWTLIDGSGTITDPSAQSTTITGLLNGTTTLQWTSTANCATDTDQTTFVVSGLPDTPVDAGIDAYTCTDPFGLSGSDPSPFTGAWTVVAGPNVPSFSLASDPNATITGMVPGTYTLQWNVTTAVCGVVTDQVQVTFGSLPPANAGTDQSGLCPTSATLDATPVAGLTGTWTYVSGPAGSAFVDANDPTTLAYGLTNGTYQFQWTLSGGGCPGSTNDVVQITVDPCTTTVTHDAFGNQTFTGCSYTYTDDGGSGSNYSNNVANTMTTFCPDDPDAFATLTFNTASVYPYDYINVYDDPSPGAPIVASIYYDPSPGGGFVYEPSVGTTITSSTGCLYVQFQSTATNNYPGWTATVGCSPTAGVQNQTFVTVNNCGGGGGITLCASGQVTAESNMDTNPPDLGLANQGCLGSQEGASNTWVYMIAESDGWIAFELQPAGGQDFDYAIWGPYDGGYACPGMTLDDPINCSWAANGGASCDATIGIGTFNTLGNAVLPTDLSEGGFCAPATNEGWTYPLYANAGDVYVLLFQNYGFNNSSFDFFVNEPGTTNIPAGESYASLGCDPVQALPIQLISFTGEHKEGMNYLYWTTASEYQNAYFIIERSDDGINWEEVTTVQGNGNSSEVNNYATVDRYPFMETTYYRLLQVDYDGTKRRYKTIALASEIEVEGLFSNVYPNPTSGTFYFNYGGNDFNNEIVVSVTNAMGQIVYSKVVQNFNASQSIEVDATEFSEGLYNVIISQGETREIKKISIIK